MFLIWNLKLLCLMVYIALTQGKEPRVLSAIGVDPRSTTDANSDDPTDLSKCHIQPLDVEDVEFLEGGKLFIKAYNLTIRDWRTEVKTEELHLCFNRSEELKNEIWNHCEKWVLDDDEYKKLENGSLYMIPYDSILEQGFYEFKNGDLEACIGKEGDPKGPIDPYDRPLSKEDQTSIVIGKVGSSISIIALSAHLFMFCLVPSLRNLPGYNLASLSVAYLVGYLFLLIGQIYEVIGVFCVISAVIQQNFFLTAFFCMNVMALDVWRTLRLATQKLIMEADDVKRNQFIFYTIYSWGGPLVITTISVILDNVKGVPDGIRPEFGRDETCWMNNNKAKTYFFSIPAFTLFMINAVLFLLSAFIIKNNKMKCSSDQQSQNVKLNFILYVRLALMMGVVWLLSIVSTLVDDKILWIISDTLTSLQGLFLFLLFTCSRKVLNRIKEKISNITSSKTSSTDKPTSSKSDAV